MNSKITAANSNSDAAGCSVTGLSASDAESLDSFADGSGQQPRVLRLMDANQTSISKLLERYGLKLRTAEIDADIPGSFWGDEEAGLIGNQLWARPDTPVHSILHETCHFICMDQARRDGLHTNAGGDYDEENAVCYLQILLADYIDGFGRSQMLKDMDAWGYSFRLGSAKAWFESDAEDAVSRLLSDGIINQHQQPTWCLRKT